MSTRPSRTRALGVAVLLALIVMTYLGEAQTRRVRVPTPATQSDQGAYLRYAREMQETNYSVVGGRNRMPGFPFLLSALYEPGLSEPEFLRRAQTFNVNLSAALLVALFFIYRRHFPSLHSAALVAITAFGVFIYRAPLVQVEVLFYFTVFCMFLAYWRMLVEPRIWLAVVSGVLTGVAHLLKASVLPALALFTACFAAKHAWEYYRQPSAGAIRSKLREASMLGLVVVIFLALVFPYIATSKRVFGSYFYNVNSTFYFWCDSWEEAKAFSRASNDRVGPPKLPPEQIPSAAKYWREHSVGEIVSRLVGGVIGRLTHNARLDGYWKYGVLLALMAAALACYRRELFVELVSARLFLALFLLLFFSCYLALFGWYERLATDARFLLLLFLPFTFAASKLIVRLADGLTLPLGKSRVPLVSVFACLLLSLATAEAILNAVRLTRRDPARIGIVSARGDCRGSCQLPQSVTFGDHL